MGERNAREPADKLVRILDRITALERRPVRASRPRGGAVVGRDAYYGVPATVAEQVELANRRPLWFNADRGWEESFFAPAGSAGLEVRGLAPGVPAAWYPTGRGPRVRLEATAGTTASAGSYVGNWHGNIHSNDGGEWFHTGTTGVRLLRAGVFDVHCWTNQQTGSGFMDYHFRKLNSTASAVARTVHQASPLLGAAYSSYTARFTSEPVLEGEQFALWCHAGSCLVHQGNDAAGSVRGQFVVEYVGPSLV